MKFVADLFAQSSLKNVKRAVFRSVEFVKGPIAAHSAAQCSAEHLRRDGSVWLLGFLKVVGPDRSRFNSPRTSTGAAGFGAWHFQQASN